MFEFTREAAFFFRTHASTPKSVHGETDPHGADFFLLAQVTDVQSDLSFSVVCTLFLSHFVG
jgi:hypothetical protein